MAILQGLVVIARRGVANENRGSAQALPPVFGRFSSDETGQHKGGEVRPIPPDIMVKKSLLCLLTLQRALAALGQVLVLAVEQASRDR